MKVRARDPEQVWKEEYESAPTRGDGLETSTISGTPLQPLYTSSDVPKREEELPGQYPYTRGIHPSGYRGRMWTMRQFSGFATAEETNRRYKYLLANGQTGLSVAFDMPTLMGQDSDAPTSRGEIGHCGVAIDSLADMETLFDGIPLADITTSMTINSPAAILLCMYIAVAEKQGVPAAKLGGTLQNDILKEFIAQKEFIFPPAPSMPVSSAACASMTSPPASRSSSMRISISSKRSRSSAPRDESGRDGCANATARRTSARGSSGSTLRRQAFR